MKKIAAALIILSLCLALCSCDLAFESAVPENDARDNDTGRSGYYADGNGDVAGNGNTTDRNADGLRDGMYGESETPRDNAGTPVR